MTNFTNPDMTNTGRRLESQVAEMMHLLAGIQEDLAKVEQSAPVIEAGRKLAAQRAELGETIARLEQGQDELESRLGHYVSELSRQEAVLEASRDDLRSLTRRLVQVQEDERRALARDLHDTSGQALTVLGLGLSMLRREAVCSNAMRARIDALQGTATMLAEELHRLAVNLRPSSLDRYGLVPAAEELLASMRAQTETEMELVVEGLEERLPGDVETALYRVIQEACTNVTRHAAASRASVHIKCDRSGVRVCVEDNGRGFDVTEAFGRGRLGLLGIRERAEMLGGSLTVESSAERGSRLLIEVPLAGKEKVRETAGAETRAGAAGREWEESLPFDGAGANQASELARAKALSVHLLDITNQVSQHETAQELLGFVLGRAAAAVGCDYALIALHEGRRWTVSHAYGLPGSMVGQRLVPAAVPLAQEIERTGRLVLVNNTRSEDPLSIAARQSGVFAGAGIPLVSGGKFLGAVAFVHNTAPIPFTRSEVAFLEHLSGLLSLALENARLRALQLR